MRLFGRKSPEGVIYKMITEQGSGFYSFDGKLYKSDIVKACLRPQVKAIGKLTAVHIRKNEESGNISKNPDAYMRMLLTEPNPYMSGQMLQEKMCSQLMLNNNAFALIVRDEFGVPCGLYPIPAMSTETVYINNELYLRFFFANGKRGIFPYKDIIHLRNDFTENDIFGDNPTDALKSLMEIVTTMDQGLVKAIKNSNIIQWLLKYSTSMRPELLKQKAEEFVKNYLSYKTTTFGAAAVDATADIQRVEPKDYVPNAALSERIIKRVYNFFNTNEKIINSQYTEDEWNSYFESVIEPLAIQMSNEFTNKLFTRKQRAFGNYIVFEASNLSCASLSTKLALQAMVDRGALTPNEWRATMNLSPVDGGDIPLRRKDTGIVTEGGEDE